MKTADSDRVRRDSVILAQVVAGISVLSFFFYLQRGDLLLYGDAIAHINIARRVFDSRTPGVLQLGTVWLPLPHLLMVPFLISDRLWQTGIGGSFQSMVAYLVGTMGIFRLVRSALSSASDTHARAAAWMAVVVYALNPNLLYLQSTAMTEPLYLAFFVWAVVYFVEWTQNISRSAEAEDRLCSPLTRCGLCIFAACLTRYDGWFLACAAGFAVVIFSLAQKTKLKKLRLSVVKFLLLAAAGPILWVAYNTIVYRNPMEFATGPYSAKALAEHDVALGHATHPGNHDVQLAFEYFLKSAELNLAPGSWGRVWLVLLVAGILAAARSHFFWPLSLLALPLLFYSLSISYSGVPIFLPLWWPFSFYNIRYGLEMLPAFAVFSGIFLHSVLTTLSSVRVRTTIALAMAVLVVGSYAAVWHQRPVCFQEAWINSRDRIPMDIAVAANLTKLPPNSALLMYTGNHVAALQQAGIPFSRVVNEGNHRPWKSPTDLEGLWERALAKPQKYVDYVVAFEGDAVDLAVNKSGLTSMAVLHSKGQPTATIYWTRRDTSRLGYPTHVIVTRRTPSRQREESAPKATVDRSGALEGASLAEFNSFSR
ncbi:MAG: hypothetical protein ABJA69_11845 [Acidobacteriaceae bacterium]